jgi:hypothetical protein
MTVDKSKQNLNTKKDLQATADCEGVDKAPQGHRKAE